MLDRDMCIDVSQDPQSVGQLIIWKKHGKKNQRFRIVESNGRYHIISSSTLHVISVNNNSPNKG